jgi:hypothetical protein
MSGTAVPIKIVDARNGLGYQHVESIQGFSNVVVCLHQRKGQPRSNRDAARVARPDPCRAVRSVLHGALI